MKDLDQEAIEKAAIESALNHGPAQDVFHPDYGWILRDGQPTEEGLLFYEQNLDELKENKMSALKHGFIMQAKRYEKLSDELSQLREELTATMKELGIDTYVQDPETLAVYKIHRPNGTFVAYKEIDYKRTNIGTEKGGGSTVLSKSEAESKGFTLGK